MSIKVAVVGLGWAARSIWLPRLVGRPDMEVTGVVDPDPTARASVVGEWPGTPVLSSTAELGPDMVDLAVVAVPNHLHSTIACRLLDRGIPVFVEKPVCLSTAEADRLAAAERLGGSVLLAGSAARYRADIQGLQRMATSVGQIRHVRLAWIRARGVPGGRGWFTRRQFAGGGALVDLGWHLLDVANQLLGPISFDQIVGTTSDDFIRRDAWQAAWRADQPVDNDSGVGAGDVEDTVRGFLVTDDGLSISLQASWASHVVRDSTLVEVHGDAGTATLRCTFGFSPNRMNGSSLTLTSAGETVSEPVVDEPVGQEYDRQLAALPGLLADPANKGRAVEEARWTIDVIHRIYDSARRARGRAFPVEEPAWTPS
jgi:oxidoreductase